MPTRPIPVFHLYYRSRQRLGSSLMRTHQLCAMAQRHGSGRFEHNTRPVTESRNPLLQRLWVARQPAGAIYVFGKKTARRLSNDAMQALRRKALAILFDHVDTQVDMLRPEGADIHLASSHGQLAQFQGLVKARKLTGTPALLLHSADLRLLEASAPKAREFAMVYCGRTGNAFLPDERFSGIDILDGGSVERFSACLERLPQYPLHYAIRPERALPSDIIAPFTKGMTAAACGANIVTNRDTPDAKILLGEDYPYFVDAPEAQAVLPVLQQAREDFGGARWQLGIERMKALHATCNAPATASSLEKILNQVVA